MIPSLTTNLGTTSTNVVGIHALAVNSKKDAAFAVLELGTIQSDGSTGSNN